MLKAMNIITYALTTSTIYPNLKAMNIITYALSPEP